MRSKITMFLSVLFLMLSLFSIAQPAAAAPAETYNHSDCFDSGDGWQFCVKNQGVYQQQTTRSGTAKETYIGSYEETFRDENGAVISQYGSKYSATYVYKDGEPQVNHQRGTDSFSADGQTCTYSYNTVYANGAVRHEDFAFDCN